ncbi:MAG: hypothetical protein BWX81_02261 [Spirochaetes bacterium ADurb.Bin110]|jgi:hypothetical protein|nr:MAG: hypothetical protein BWX81_02261 [Spirochaetes bacterium ADurb.Bin110]
MKTLGLVVPCILRAIQSISLCSQTRYFCFEGSANAYRVLLIYDIA